MSRFSTTVDAIVSDLQAHVDGLNEDSASVSRYFPWNPEQLEPDGLRHFAVWPEPNAEQTSPVATGTFQFAQNFVVLIWEGTGAEGTRLVADEEAGKAFLDLGEAVLDRFMVEANQTLGGGSPLWYVAWELSPATAQVRWMRILLSNTQYQSFTT